MPLRLNEPDDGYAELKAPTMFDRPWPMNSWLPSIRCPDLVATARAIDTASVSPSTVSASAAGKILRQVSGSNDGSGKRRECPTAARRRPAPWPRRRRAAHSRTGCPRSSRRPCTATRGSHRFAASATTSVTRAGRRDPRVEVARCAAANSVERLEESRPDGIGTPKKLRSWAAMMSRPAPAVKPITTVCEMKLTSAPRRATPIANCSRPTSRARVSTSSM